MPTDRRPIEKLISRETEKAILVTVTTERGRRDVWFPRSQIEISGLVIFVADWLLAAKGRDIGAPIVTLDRTVAAQMAA